MGTISYVVPVAGTDLNAIADPEIATALTTIKTLVNGNIDTNNLSPTAGITFAQLAAGAGRMSLVTKTAAYAANSGELVLAGVTGAPFTVTLPVPSLNALVGVVAGASATGANPITVARHSADVINGVGLSSATSFALGAPGAFAVLQSDGTNWFMIAGQQDTGWLTITPTAGYNGSVGGNYVASVRVRGDQGTLKGSIISNSTNNAFGTVATVARPSAQVTFGAIVATGGTPLFGFMPTTGVLTSGGTVASGYAMELDGLAYSLS